MREPLLLPVLAIAAGIYIGEVFGFTAWEAAWPSVAFAGLALLSSIAWVRTQAAEALEGQASGSPLKRRNWTRWVAGALALIFCGAWLAAIHRPQVRPILVADEGKILPREIVTLDGCVVEPSVLSGDRLEFAIEMAPGARVRVQAYTGVQAFIEGAERTQLRYGQRVSMEARVRSPHNFANPGSFDYAAYLARRQIYWTALVPAKGEIRVGAGQCGSAVKAWIFELRTTALDRIDRLYSQDRYAQAMLKALLLGESAGLERVWTEDFRRSGTYHALVISGVHVAVLAGTVLFALRLLQVPPLAALAITASIAWLYASVSGFSTPVVRAAGGFTLYLIGSVLFRRARVLNLLSAVALVLLALDPGQLFEASFQLSFLAVAALGALAEPYLDRTITPRARATRSADNTDLDPHLEPRAAQFRIELRLVAETISLWTPLAQRTVSIALAWAMRGLFAACQLAVLSVAIQIALSVAMAVYFHRVSFTGISANLAVVPLTELIVPLGFVALLTGSSWAAWSTGILLRWAAAVAAWHADLEPAWRVPAPPIWLALAFVAVLLACAWALRRTKLRWPGIAAAMVLLALLVWSPWPPDLARGELELTAIDVGQGESLLVVFPEGATMLIDAGGRLAFGEDESSRDPPPGEAIAKLASSRGLDTGEDVVSPYLWSRGIQRLDILAITHNHRDHTGGVPAIIENFRPREIWTGSNPPPGIDGVTVRHAGPPQSLSGAVVEVLAPLETVAGETAGRSNPNNDSLTLRIDYGERSFLLTGDLERARENDLLGAGSTLDVDVLKVGHHGSRTSTSPLFLEAVSPSIAVISAGFENAFGHPHPDVVERLGLRGTTILRTDLSGLITIRTDGHRLTFDTAQGSPWRQRSLPVHLLN